MKVFLGGTCNESGWREFLIKGLAKDIDYFNPVVSDWTHDCVENEINERKSCDILLTVITPKMTGCYSVAEVIDDSNKFPEKTLFCLMSHEQDGTSFSEGQLRSLYAVRAMVERNGGKIFCQLYDVANFLNEKYYAELNAPQTQES